MPTSAVYSAGVSTEYGPLKSKNPYATESSSASMLEVQETSIVAPAAMDSVVMITSALSSGVINENAVGASSVSYTHLTLPTIITV